MTVYHGPLHLDYKVLKSKMDVSLDQQCPWHVLRAQLVFVECVNKELNR